MLRKIALIFFLAIAGLPVFGQNKEALQDKYDKILKEIGDAQTVLNQTKKTKDKTLSQLEVIKSMLATRQNLIDNINTQINSIDNDMKETQDVITSLGSDLDTLKASYARLCYYAYKNQSSDDKLLYIFASNSFNDAYERVKYMQKMTDFRKKQAILIVATEVDLTNKMAALQDKKNLKLGLLGENQTQKKQLDSEKQETNELVGSLKSQEKQLKKDIDTKKKAADDLNKDIQRIIANEIALAKKKAEDEAKKNALNTKPGTVTKPVKETNVLALTPEDSKLSTDFAGNKGKFPWPVERGVITGKFGKQPHPVLDNVYTNNNGVDIKTEEGSGVRCIFEGTVAAITFNPTFQKAVLIRHGDYFTVYSNLKETTVKTGDHVTLKQNIGTVYTNPTDNTTEVHLEIWQNMTVLDPSDWLLSK